MSRNFRELFPGERAVFTTAQAVFGIFRTTLPSSIETIKNVAGKHAGTLGTLGNIIETGGTLITGLTDDPRFFIPGVIATGIGKAVRQFGSRQQTISFRDMPHKRRRNGRSRRFQNFGIQPRRRRTNLLRKRASNLMRIEMLERALTDLPQKEIKNYDTSNIDFPVFIQGSFIPSTKLSDVPQGIDLNNRIGEQITAHRLLWSVIWKHDAKDDLLGVQKSVQRLVIFVDSETIDSLPTEANTFFQPISGLTAFYNDKFPSRFLVLVDRTYDAKWHRENYIKTDGGVINIKGLKIQSNGSLQTQIGKNSIFALLISETNEFRSDEPASKVIFKTRLEFTG